MLDDLKYIHDKDKYDALGTVEKEWQQLGHVYKYKTEKKQFSNIVHSGMGGSALWALVGKSWPRFNIPFEVVQGYDTPEYVDEGTLFIASSVSGNTEETLSALDQAESKNATIVVITSGGKLAERAKVKGYTLIELPTIRPPRYGMLYGLKGLTQVSEDLGILAKGSFVKDLEDASKFLEMSVSDWLADVPTAKNYAKKLALEYAGKTAVFYGGPLLGPAAHKWKIGFNENAKNVSWHYEFPEFNHNEFTGWTSHPVDKPFAVTYLLSSFDNDRIKKRFKLSEKFLSGRWPSPIHIEAKGSTPLEQLLWTVVLGDFVSVYLALLNGFSPIDMGNDDIIEHFKKEMN